MFGFSGYDRVYQYSTKNFKYLLTPSASFFGSICTVDMLFGYVYIV